MNEKELYMTLIFRLDNIFGSAPYINQNYPLLQLKYANVFQKISNYNNIDSILSDHQLMSEIIEVRKQYFIQTFDAAVNIICDTAFILHNVSINKDQIEKVHIYQMDESIPLPIYGDVNYDLKNLQTYIDNTKFKWSGVPEFFIRPNSITISPIETSVTIKSYQSSFGMVRIETKDSKYTFFDDKLVQDADDSITHIIQKNLPFDHDEKELIETNYLCQTFLKRVYSKIGKEHIFYG